MIEARGEDLAAGGVLQHLRDRVHHRLEDQLGILLDPAEPWVRDRHGPSRLRHRAQVGVEQGGLHGRGALVDAQQQPGAHPRLRPGAWVSW